MDSQELEEETKEVYSLIFTFFQFAFIGRSNVGKSTLINSILDLNIAKTAKRPGKTQKLYFF